MKATGHCLNCGHPLHGKYCPNCGQPASTGRLSLGGLLYEFIHTITHAEKSILGTTKEMLLHPARVVTGYINGKRRSYASPATYFLVWVTASILLHRGIISMQGFHPVFKKGITFSDAESIRAFVVHGEWLYILTFPVSALLFWIILASPTYRYIEALVITIYVFSTVYALHVVCYLIGGLLLQLNVLHWGFYLLQILIALIFTIWVLTDFYRKVERKGLAWRVPMYILLNTVVVLKVLEWLAGAWSRIFPHGAD